MHGAYNAGVTVLHLSGFTFWPGLLLLPNHIVLLGDSVFDNAPYVRGEPDVLAQLRDLLPEPWGATLCAVDGHTTAELPSQLPKIPKEASHLVVSIGGNDALMNADLLGTPTSSSAETLRLFHDRIQRFESKYREAIESVLSLRQEAALCTIYNGNLDPGEAPIARVVLMMFNDVILRVAFERGMSIVDLRSVCDEPSDYANPIEPSSSGGRKIAETVARAVGAVGAASSQSRVFGGEQSRAPCREHPG